MLIVDMPMPKNCSECEAKCVSSLYGRICGMTRKNIMPFLDKTNRPDWCPVKGELVRCGECANETCSKIHKDMPNWFCADGERKDNEMI